MLYNCYRQLPQSPMVAASSLSRRISSSFIFYMMLTVSVTKETPPPCYGNTELNKRARTCTIMFCVHAYLFVRDACCVRVCVYVARVGVGTESIERFIEGQAFLLSFDSAPRPPPPPRSSVSWTGDTQEDWEKESTCWREREMMGADVEPKRTRSMALYQ